MKQKTLTLKRNVLVIEFPKDSRDYKLFNDKEKPYVSYWQGIETKRLYLPEGSYTLLGKHNDLKEQDVKDLVEQKEITKFKNYQNDKWLLFSALESFNSALEKEIFWVNAFGKEPNHMDYKFEKYPNEFHFKSESHKSRYGNAFEKWQVAELGTFDRTRTLIFVEN